MDFSHLDEKGNAKMVDVSNKANTHRTAVATGKIYMQKSTISRILEVNMPKGDVFSTARIAGVMGAKHTFELIPMCHNIPIDSVSVEFLTDEESSCINIIAKAVCVWKTGVEMEALTAVSIAALTLFDMCKAVDKEMVISDIKVLKKSGGKEG
jgi:cyclic pyranopterin phosphate synthase